MFNSAESLRQLANRLARMPGIGRKTAARLAFHILKLSQDDAEELATLIREVKQKVGFCSTCFNISESDPCPTCISPSRRRDLICVVEDTADAAALEKVDQFKGLFHVLGGRLSPLDGIGPDDLHIAELLSRVKDDVAEIILATNPNVEGEATAVYLSRLLKPFGIKISRIARGLPVGSDLEFADSTTLARALEGRQDFE
ncbi:MAG: recombination mediator RecR [Candidatus Zixiibacteriota bacterium]